MKKIMLFLVAVFIMAESHGGDVKYPVSAIPEELKQNVNVVVREDHMKFRILEKNRAIQHVHYVATILNENGKDYASEDIGYDKLTKILDLNAVVYDADGKLIKKLKNREIYDHASYDGFTLFSDDRIKSIDLSLSVYPYTVEFEYELELNFLYYIPGSWWGTQDVSYQHVSYELSYPPALAPRYKLFNIEGVPSKSLTSGFETIAWTFENIKPVKTEASGPPVSEIMPHILAAPSQFEFSGYSGTMDSWQHFGQWVKSLNNGRDALPPETRAKVREIVSGLHTKEEKVKALYEYLQNKTRYVGIQIGIGGYQPFEASVVDKNGYGDCKALSNYMVALCKEAGITANYVLISAGSNPSFNVDFPSTQFNHAIAAVANGADTIWLECTSQTNPFGYQGRFTGDRKALMITEDGASVVKTIQYKPEDNLQSRTAELSIDAAGNAKAIVKTKHTGTQYENGNLDNALADTDSQRKWLEKNTEIPNFSINSFSMKQRKDKIPSATISLDLTLNRYASVSGKRLFVSPNLMNKNTYIPPKIAERKTDVVRQLNYLDRDTINISIPENLYPEFLPEPVKLRSKFGEYDASFTFDAGKVTYIRRMKVWRGTFPKETYSELVDFYKNVSKADNIKLVFLNKT